jgi:hypothetical protein
MRCRSVSWLLLSLLAAAAGCKQGEGGRCQLDSDCSGALVCNQATGTCQTERTTGGDAGFPIDARLDAGPPMPDAAPVVPDAPAADAAPADAALPDAAI